MRTHTKRGCLGGWTNGRVVVECGVRVGNAKPGAAGAGRALSGKVGSTTQRTQLWDWERREVY